jgi:hypothetical protein
MLVECLEVLKAGLSKEPDNEVMKKMFGEIAEEIE